MTSLLPPRMAETSGVYWARNFTLSTYFFKGRKACHPVSFHRGGSGRAEGRGHAWAATGQAQAGEGAPRMPHRLSQMAPGQS